MSDDSGSVPPVQHPPRDDAAASGSAGDASGSGNDSDSGGDKSNRSMWNYYFEKPHSSQYVPGGKVPVVAGAANVESFTQNLKLLGRVRA
jgi:hypothetical protein